MRIATLKFGLVLGASCLLAGCTTRTDYRQPTTPPTIVQTTPVAPPPPVVVQPGCSSCPQPGPLPPGAVPPPPVPVLPR